MYPIDVMITLIQSLHYILSLSSTPFYFLYRSEEQLMLTKVFYTHRRMMSSCSLNDFSESCPLPGNMSSQVIDHLGHIPKQHSFHYSLRPPSSSPGMGILYSFV